MKRAGVETGTRRTARRAAGETLPESLAVEPYLETWLALTPGQRLARAWRLRSRLPDLQAVHDAKTYPDA